MRSSALAAVLALAAAASPIAAAPRTARAPRVVTVTVDMADRHFRPDVIRLSRGQPTRLVLVNHDASGHNFDAAAFFYSCRILGGARLKHDGTIVEVPSQSTRTITVVPNEARPFDLKSSTVLDRASGMTGQILVY